MDAINPSVDLTEAERIDRLRLIRSDNVGPRVIMAQTPQAFRRDADHLKEWSMRAILLSALA